MTVEQMIEFLKSFPQQAIVRARDHITEDYLPVTGMVYGESREFVDLETDHDP